RVALPEGAAGLDRVRGGQELSVVYARGEAVMCAVFGSSKLEAKLFQLEAKPADVALLGPYLLAAYPDGRVALYDIAAIACAGAAPLAAVSAVELGAKGKPRVILAGRGKSGPALWVGTSAGEVFSASLPEKPAEAATHPRAERAARVKEAPEQESSAAIEAL